jgi:2-methylisocitrate lyase-like PEP mutase family enzyme
MITLPEMVENARMIAGIRPDIPLVADADTGFGGPAMIDRTVRSYERLVYLYAEARKVSS